MYLVDVLVNQTSDTVLLLVHIYVSG